MTEQTGQTGSDLRARAEELLTRRLDAIGALESAAAGVEAARASLATAEAVLREAELTATAAGWTTGELRQLGITPPRTGSRGRSNGAPKRRRTTSAPASV